MAKKWDFSHLSHPTAVGTCGLSFERGLFIKVFLNPYKYLLVCDARTYTVHISDTHWTILEKITCRYLLLMLAHVVVML
jgi:hypothetical protein